MNDNLADKHCLPCRGGAPALRGPEIEALLVNLSGWEVINEHHLSRTFKFPDFASALSWVNKLGEIAEAEGHHPDIYLAWGKVQVEIWTHKINGLTESDFVLAAKADRIYLCRDTTAS